MLREAEPSGESGEEETSGVRHFLLDVTAGLVLVLLDEVGEDFLAHTRRSFVPFAQHMHEFVYGSLLFG